MRSLYSIIVYCVTCVTCIEKTWDKDIDITNVKTYDRMKLPCSQLKGDWMITFVAVNI